MDTLLNQLLHFATQTRLLHWQTTSYARHKAYGKLYDSLDDFLDSFVEVVQGRAGQARLKVLGPIDAANLGDNEASAFIDELVEFLTSLTDVFVEEEDTALINLRDDALAAALRTRYLLTLS